MGKNFCWEGQAVSQIHVRAALRQENRLLSWGIHFFLTAALTAAQPPGG